MCPACFASAALVIASLTFTGGLTALLGKKRDAKRGAKKLVGKENPKEEPWEK